MITAVYRNARYEQRIAVLEVELANAQDALVNIGNLGIATSMQLASLCARLNEQMEMLPGERPQTLRGAMVN